MMKLLLIPAISAVFFNDILGILSLAGSSLLFLSALFTPHLRRLEEIGGWCIAPLVFGLLFQVSLILYDLQPEKIGFVLPMPPGPVTGLFGMSLVLLAGWWWLHQKALHG